MSLLEEPLLTRELLRNDFCPERDATYLHAMEGNEDRSALGAAWQQECVAAGVAFAHVVVETRDDLIVSSAVHGIVDELLQLRDNASLRNLMRRLRPPVYLDITGLTYSCWAPLLRAGIDEGVDLRVVYVEPATYTRAAAPTQGMIYDLSERIDGIAPLPGFASLRRRDRSGSSCFVPMLGFEGARLGYVMEEVQPPVALVAPLVGVPGFRPEYPFFAYAGNRVQLESDFMAARVRYAKANCPFDAFHELFRIARDHRADLLTVAPIGTKPHGVGAVLFALSRPHAVELVYDHPIRKANRTTGEARVCVYDVGRFVTSDLYLARGTFGPVTA